MVLRYSGQCESLLLFRVKSSWESHCFSPSCMRILINC